MVVHAENLQGNETRHRLLRAAAEEFARHGFASARVRSIVDAAKANLAAVNYYFGGKEGLYRATLEFLAAQRQPEGAPGSPIPGAEERLQGCIRAMLERFIGEHPSPLGRILAYEAMAPTGNLESILEDTMGPELERIAALLREIAGPQVDDARLMHAALGIFGQCMFRLYARSAFERMSASLGREAKSAHFIAAQITEFSLGGLERLKRASVTEK